MRPLLNIYKPVGKTPYEMVKKVKEVFPELSGQKVGYAGRLDPMAAGVLLLLVGERNKHKEEYELLPKKYTFEVVFGMQTDSYDLLGKVVNDYQASNPEELKQNISKEIKNYEGRFVQTYPPYSAIRLNGKPLYYWELRGKLLRTDIPKKEVMIHSLTLGSTGSLSSEELHLLIKKRISLVNGTFRQEEILKKWDIFFQKNKNTTFTTVQFRLDCSSGTYVRSIVNDLGKKMGCGATTLSILRTAVGTHTVQESLLM